MKKIFWAALLPMAFAACTNEELVVMETPEMEDGMITLGENFAIGVTRGVEASETRLAYATDLKGVYWMPEDGAPAHTDKLGLCWLGVKDGKIYTNYQFDHFAWSVKGKTPVVDKCTGKWNDLVFVHQPDYTDDAGEDCAYASAWNKYDELFVPTITPTKTADLTNGYFKTENLTIFGGDYLIYSPYNKEVVNACFLPVATNSAFTGFNAVENDVNTNAKKNLALKGLADEHFYVGYGPLKGGETANGFDLTALTGTINLQIKKHEDATIDWDNIFKVAIYGKDIIVEQEYDAVKKEFGTVLNTSTSLVSTLANPFDVTKKGHTLFIPAMPQTIKDAQVVLFAGTGVNDVKSVICNVGDIVVKSNEFTNAVTVDLKNSNPLQSNTYYVVDMPTFQAAMTSAAWVGVEPVNIKLLNDIVYDDYYTTGMNGDVYVNKNMNISGGNIIVPAGQSPREELSLQVMNGKTLTIDGEIIIEGQGECDDCAPVVSIFGIQNDELHPGKIILKKDVSVGENATLTIGNEDSYYTNIVFEKTLTNDNEITFTGNATVSIDELVNNKTAEMVRTALAVGNYVEIGTLTNAGEAVFNVGAYTKLTVNEALTNEGELYIAKSSGAEGTDGTVNNNGTATNKGLISNEGVYNNYASTTLADGSEFIDHVGSQYGVNMPTKTGNAEYICIVNTSDKTDGDRLGYALGTKMPTTTVRFESGAAHTYQLGDYASLAKLATVKYEINTPGVDFVFKNNVADSQVVLGTSLVVTEANSLKFNGNETKIGGDVTVEKLNNIISNNGTLSAQVEIAGNLTMNDGNLVVEALKNATAATELTTPSWIINGDVALNADATIEVDENAALLVKKNLTIAKNASATFQYSSYSDINGAITNNGTFTRILSSGYATANPAQVWCTKYNPNGTQVNAGPQVYE